MNNIFNYKEIFYKVLPPLSLFICFSLAFWSALHKMSYRWSGGDNNYCYLVVPLFLYLCWDRRNKPSAGGDQKLEVGGGKDRRLEDQKLRKLEGEQVEGFRFGEFTWSIFGLVPIFFSIGLILVGEMGSVETLAYTGIWGCIVGLVMVLYGWRIRYLIFPLIILLFIVPLPPYINRMLTFQLKLAASSLATLMLRVSGVSVFQDGNVIDLGVSQLQVVDACSGLRYLIPLVLLALLVGYFFSKGLWRRVVLLFFVIPISVFLNSFRIWITGILTVNGHGELAENLFHDFTGWLVFMIAGAMLFGITLVLKRIGRVRPTAVGGAQSSRLEVGGKKGFRPAADGGSLRSRLEVGGEKGKSSELRGKEQIGWTKPIVLTAIACLLFITSGYALKKIPSARNLPQRQDFKSFPMQIGEWQGKRSYIEQEILDQLWSDDYVQATYFKPNSRNAIHVLIPFYEYQAAHHTAHAPQACLLGGGWALTQSIERTIKMDDGQQITLMTMNLEKGNSKILGSYFFFMRGRVITSPWINKFYLMWDSFSRQRTDGALVRAEMVVAPGQSMDDAWVELAGFIAGMWEILPKYVPE
jgi:EpsI family protein